MEKDKFISIINDNQKLILKICFTYCQIHENRKDLQQEILMQLWNSSAKFDGRVKISTWIYRIALNTAISYYRKDFKHFAYRESIDESIISISNFEIESEINENISLLYKYINNMDELDKALILLYLDDNKYKEIGDILGISETNVATKISRIKKRLKQEFSNI